MHEFLSSNRTNAFETLRNASLMRQTYWDRDHKISLEYRGLELGGEAGEAQNKLKKLVREALKLRGSRSSVAEVAEELADVIIVVDLIAGMLNIDLWPEVVSKFNKTSQENDLPVRIISGEV